MSITHGVILFAHGARDPRWAEPFERAHDQVAAAMPEARVVLAFLELMQPALHAAMETLVTAGCTRVDIVPVFLGQGSHLRRDLPELVDAQRARWPDVVVRVAPAVGDDAGVVAAIAAYCVRVSGAS